jgi:hypothetical protein
VFELGEFAFTSTEIEDLLGLAEGDDAVLRWYPRFRESFMSAAFRRAFTGIQEFEMFRFSSRSILVLDGFLGFGEWRYLRI